MAEPVGGHGRRGHRTRIAGRDIRRRLPIFVQQVPDDEASRALIAGSSGTPPRLIPAAQIMRFNGELDVRPLLGSISAPTLVLHCTGDPLVPGSISRPISRACDGGYPGNFHVSWLVENQRVVLDAMEAYLLGRVSEQYLSTCERASTPASANCAAPTSPVSPCTSARVCGGTRRCRHRAGHRTVRDLVAGSGIEFEARGEHRLQGIDDNITVFAAVA